MWMALGRDLWRLGNGAFFQVPCFARYRVKLPMMKRDNQRILPHAE